MNKVGRRSHGGVYRKTDEISTNAAASIAKWRFVTEIRRQTACVKFTRDERTFYWHPVAKKFRREGEAAWSHLPSGRGVVALMLHLHGKEELYGIPHFGAMLDRPPMPHGTNTDNPIDFPGAAGSARASTGGATGEPESHTVGHARAENSRAASPKKPTDADMARWAAIDEEAEAAIHSWEGGQR